MWHDNDTIMEIYNAANCGKITFPSTCPVCNNRAAHLYIHKHNNEHSGIWTWCSKCGASSHMSAKTPKWWKNPNFIESDKLCSNPDYLNSLSDKIDEWVTKHIPADSTQTNKPFVMENKFNVCFKDNYSTITAGTIGTLIIKDDFNSMSIFFIDSDNKKIKVDLSPEKLMEIVDVVK